MPAESVHLAIYLRNCKEHSGEKLCWLFALWAKAAAKLMHSEFVNLILNLITCETKNRFPTLTLYL